MTPEDHEKKGAKINQDIDQQFKPDNPTDRVDHAAVDKKFNAGYQVSDGQTNRPPRGGNFQQTGPPGNMKDQMGKSNLPTGDDYSNVKIHSKMDPEDPTKKTPTNALGLPQRDPVTDRSHADGAIVGQSAYADKDANNKKGADSTNALPSSDLMAKGHEAAGHDFGQTQGVVAQQVVNPDSQRTIKAVHDGQPGWKTTDKGDEPGNFNRLTGTGMYSPLRLIASRRLLIIVVQTTFRFRPTRLLIVQERGLASRRRSARTIHRKAPQTNRRPSCIYQAKVGTNSRPREEARRQRPRDRVRCRRLLRKGAQLRPR